MQDDDLDDLFGRMRDAAPMPSARLLSRIEADALAEQDRRAVAATARARIPAPRRKSLWASFFGDRAVLATLGCATLAGVWIGLAQPQPVADLSERLVAAFGTSSDDVDLLPTLDSFVMEG